ncbi:MAG: TauD/TfdA dioxygenase family protein [Pseudomonadota bacterium]
MTIAPSSHAAAGAGPKAGGPPFELRALSPAIGAEILGVDLGARLDAERFEAIRQAWHRSSVLLFRHQELSEADQLRFAERFGELARLVTKTEGMTGHPAVLLVSNVRKDGKLIGALPDGEMLFHSDQCYVERPCMATLLYAIEIPSVGGNTLFANMYQAYETLPEAIKRRLAGLKAMNVYDYAANPTARTRASAPDAPAYAHPIVRTHPATGRKALYVNRLMSESIVGLKRAESDRLLGFLFDHQERREFVYEHAWTPGDLVLWDNRSTLHARTDFSAAERRLLRRVAIKGEKPV